MKDPRTAKLYESLNGGEISYFELLERLVGKLKPKSVLEIGSGWGLSAIAFLRKTDARLVTIDKQGLDTLKLFKERVDLMGLWDRIRMVTGDSKEVLPGIKEKFDIVYIDGDHTYRGAKSDFDLAWEKCEKGGTILVDDVFHYLNWENREPGTVEGEFGVARAFGEWAMHHGRRVTVYPVANGMGRVEV